MGKEIEKELSVAQVKVALQTLLREKSCKQLDTKVAKLKKVQSLLKLREGESITPYLEQTKTAPEPPWLRTKYENKKAKTAELDSTATKSERSAKLAKVVCRVDNSFGAPSSVPYSAQLAERDEFRNCCKTLVLENHCILGPAKEAKQFRSMVADIGKVFVWRGALFQWKEKNGRLSPGNTQSRSRQR